MSQLVRAIASRLSAAFAALGLSGALAGAAMAQVGTTPIVIDPSHPATYWLAAGTVAKLPAAPASGLIGLPSGNIGWFEFAFANPKAGWRQLVVEGRGNLGHVELEIDSPPNDPVTMARAGSLLPGQWVWLTPGEHHLRVTVNYWTGLPAITGIRLTAPDIGQNGAFRIVADRDRPVTAIGACEPMHVLAGGSPQAAEIDLSFQAGDRPLGKTRLPVPPSAEPKVITVPVPCTAPGDVTATATMAGGKGIRAVDTYTVFDTAPVKPISKKGELVSDIDAAARNPDFSSGATMVARGAGGAYRESSDRGTNPFVRGQSSTPPSWFAYRVTGLTPGRSYLFDVEYPDDGDRVFVVAFRDSQAQSYPISLGAETGGVWPVSGRMVHRSAIIWPASADARVIVYTLHDGKKAAVSHIRFYAVDRGIAPAAAQAGGRDYSIWSEEGGNFGSVVGQDGGKFPYFAAVDRYVGMVKESGATIFSPSVAIYNFQLYPSRYSLTFADRGSDLTAAFLLSAQHFGLKAFPEMYSRSDELIWPPRTQEEFNRRLLLSAKGESNYDGPKGSANRPPYYNALDPDVRRWYLNVVGELADRYKDYPAFAGIQLRASNWQNPALDNLVSLDWGYDAATVNRFFHETGLAVPLGLPLNGDDAGSAGARHAALLAKYRDAWVQWRCEQVAGIFRDIVARVRKARPDLTVRLFFFSQAYNQQPGYQNMREEGLDLELLKKIDGLVLVDGRFQHGAKEASLDWQRMTREGALSANGVGLFASASQRPATLFPMQYFEINGKVAQAQQLGWPPVPQDPWVSASSEPPERLRLARFAELLASFDVYELGDGGNGYVFSSPDLVDFLAEFRALPRQPFERLAGTPEGVAVRQKGNLFYVVSVSPQPASLTLKVDGAKTIESLASNAAVPLAGNTLTVKLAPYELRAFRVKGDSAEPKISLMSFENAK